MTLLFFIALIMGFTGGAAAAGTYYRSLINKNIASMKSISDSNTALFAHLASSARLNSALLKEVAGLQASAQLSKAITGEPLTMEKMRACMDKLPRHNKVALNDWPAPMNLSSPPFSFGCFYPGEEKPVNTDGGKS